MKVGEITPDALQGLLHSDSPRACIDVRERGEFALEHIPGTTPLARGTLEYRVETMIPSRRIPTVVCCDDGRRSHLAGSTLREMGYEDVRILAGGLERWRAGGFPTRQGWGVTGKEYGEKVAATKAPPEITAEELALSRSYGQKIVVADVRSEEEFVRGHVPAAYSVPGGQLLMELPRLPVGPESKLVISCAGRTRGILGAQMLREAGLRNVYVLKNGSMGWWLAGYELEEGEGSERPEQPSKDVADWVERASRTLIEEEKIRFISAEELEKLRTSGEVLYAVDVRLPGEFYAGHVPGSFSLPAGQVALAHENFIAVRHALIVVLADDEVRPVWAAALCQRLGFGRVAVLQGGIDAWARRGGILEKGEPARMVHGLEKARTHVSAVKALGLRELIEHKKGIVILDVRGSGEFGFGHIPAARWLSRGKLELEIEKVLPAKKKPVITVCDSGVRSLLAAATLKSLGYLNVEYLERGLGAWQKEGLPLADGLEGTGVTLEEAQGDFGHTLFRGALKKSRSQMERYLSWEEALGHKYASEESEPGHAGIRSRGYSP